MVPRLHQVGVQNHVIPAEWSSDHFISSCYLLIDIIINFQIHTIVIYTTNTGQKLLHLHVKSHE